ncbi:ferrochelatase [Rubritalea squalenifaciens DSM 18772]|uniref:Ferrochelatase n=1 Tax=Rubritalea squalenifaciens DSM 18772 TaxID=1123071 RepID=A0A1M6NQM8_9BACT|nr:ferrochelatase [Rubritalea squalenifaciens]SHJ98023.1 ferrochelatase [Rubritalea squalenifaciens DSM 18772]
MAKGVILLNLGSPDSTDPKDVRTYLDEFLSDPRVLDINPIVRTIILKLFILPTRPKQSAEAYSKVWTGEGSPLIVTSYQQQELVKEKVDLPIYLAMRYGNPSTASIVSEMKKDGIDDLLIIPLYPHYAMSSYESAVVELMEQLDKHGMAKIKTTLVQPFYKDDDYIEALWESIRPHYEGTGAHLMMSYHGIPERQVKKSDPSHAHCLTTNKCCDTPHPAHATCYRHQCFATSYALMAKAGIHHDDVTISFQSRLLKDPWLKPYTDFEIERLAKEGVKKLRVICPAFITDCLETLEEIAMEGKEEFLEHGGEDFELIPCLNTHPAWINWLAKRIETWQNA